METCIKCGNPDKYGLCDQCCGDFCDGFIDEHQYDVGYGPEHDLNQAFIPIAKNILRRVKGARDED